ncbi:MAG: efflux RND transporter permease subunit, partial [Bacillota bacterium]
MQKIAGFIVNRRVWIMGLMILLTLASVVMLPRVEINYNMADYLPDDSETILGLEAMEDEFGRTGTAQVMLTGVSAETATDISDEISDFESVQFVTFDEHSKQHYLEDEMDGTALLQVTIDADDYSEEAEAVVLEIEDAVENYNAHLAGPSVSNYELQQTVLSEIPWIIAVAFGIVLLILLFTAHSWFEPIPFFIVVAMAIVINMGTNAFFDDVSYLTQSVAAVLQLGLSMNYSIILLNRYDLERGPQRTDKEAMKEALARSIRPITSSALTTIAGMLALTFMTYGIGMDLGVVLAKGILISLLSVFLILPGVLLMSSKLMDKTTKHPINLTGKPFTRIALRGRSVIPIITILIVAGAFWVQTTNDYFFADDPNLEGADMIEETFGKNTPVTVTAKNHEGIHDEEEAFLEAIEDTTVDGERVLQNQSSYVSTALAPLDPSDTTRLTGLDEAESRALFSLYMLEKGMMEEDAVRVSDMIVFLEGIAEDSPYEDAFDDDARSAIDEYYELYREIDEPFTYEEAAETLDVSEFQMLFLYFSYHSEDYDPDEPLMDQTFALAQAVLADDFDGTETIELGKLIRHIDDLEASGAVTLSDDESETIDRLSRFLESLDERVGPGEAATLSEEIDEDQTKLLYALYHAEEGSLPENTIRAKDLLDFVDEQLEANAYLEAAVGQDANRLIERAYSEIEFAEEQFSGEDYSRLILTFDIGTDGDDPFNLVEELRKEGKEAFSEDVYFSGTLISNYDIAQAFESDLLRINLITVGALVLLMGLAFRSYTLPFILVIIIQGAIWLSMSVNAIMDRPIFFLTYIVVIAIQMGATVDYGILIASNYLEYRTDHTKSKALGKALKESLPTVFTSGLILITAGLAVGTMSSQMSISSVGNLLARGAAVSVVFVLLLLPAILYTFDRVLEKTTIK